MLRFGSADGPVVVAAPALFEEGNRTRAFLVRILRLLADRGIASALPDLPGQGESSVPTEEARLSHWRAAFDSVCAAVAADRPLLGTVSVRAGALVEATAPVPARWRLSPSSGEEVAREMARIWRAGQEARHPDNKMLRRWGMHSLIACGGEIRDVAGNRVHRALFRELEHDEAQSSVAGVRVVRLDTDPRPADLKFPGRPLWRASEPDVDEALAQALADDIVDWLRMCAA